MHVEIAGTYIAVLSRQGPYTYSYVAIMGNFKTIYIMQFTII